MYSNSFGLSIFFLVHIVCVFRDFSCPFILFFANAAKRTKRWTKIYFNRRDSLLPFRIIYVTVLWYNLTTVGFITATMATMNETKKNLFNRIVSIFIRNGMWILSSHTDGFYAFNANIWFVLRLNAFTFTVLLARWEKQPIAFDGQFHFVFVWYFCSPNDGEHF